MWYLDLVLVMRQVAATVWWSIREGLRVQCRSSSVRGTRVPWPNLFTSRTTDLTQSFQLKEATADNTALSSAHCRVGWRHFRLKVCGQQTTQVSSTTNCSSVFSIFSWNWRDEHQSWMSDDRCCQFQRSYQIGRLFVVSKQMRADTRQITWRLITWSWKKLSS